MFALVLWAKTKNISVVSENETRTGKDGISKAKWGDKWYEAKVIKKGGMLLHIA